MGSPPCPSPGFGRMKNPNDMFWYVGGYRATFLWASKGRCLEPPDRHAFKVAATGIGVSPTRQILGSDDFYIFFGMETGQRLKTIQ
jgi:hypothetical protein